VPPCPAWCPAVHHRSSAHAAAFVLVSGATTLYSRHTARGVITLELSAQRGMAGYGNTWGVHMPSGSSSRKFAVFKFNLNL